MKWIYTYPGHYSCDGFRVEHDGLRWLLVSDGIVVGRHTTSAKAMQSAERMRRELFLLTTGPS